MMQQVEVFLILNEVNQHPSPFKFDEVVVKSCGLFIFELFENKVPVDLNWNTAGSSLSFITRNEDLQLRLLTCCFNPVGFSS